MIVLNPVAIASMLPPSAMLAAIIPLSSQTHFDGDRPFYDWGQIGLFGIILWLTDGPI